LQNQPQTSVETFASQRDLNDIKENSGKYEILMPGSTPPDYTVVLITTPYFCLGTRYRWSSKESVQVEQ
jgi:hypothetical protein